MRALGVLVGIALAAMAVPLACGGNDFSSNTGGAPSSSTGTGAFGGGIDGPCKVADDCPGQDLPCLVRACNAGACDIAAVPLGTPTESQLAGDCKKAVCDGKGSETTTHDDGDVYDDGNDCTSDGCAAGTSKNEPKPVGTPCSGGVCKAGGECVECVDESQCVVETDLCVGNVCVSPHCIDGITNSGETDVDCGGPDCAKCGVGKVCGQDADCKSGVCNGTCQAPTCSDGVANGGETDTDCGGPNCPGCDAGNGCAVGSDCQSGVCIGGVCQAGTCTDGVMNQDETDVDCGGTCPGCADGHSCNNDDDCASQACKSGKCFNHCTDNVKDADESDVDCGGSYCAKCADGEACNCNDDCASGVCCTMATTSGTTEKSCAPANSPCPGGTPCPNPT